jgi:hypothetical protein
MACRGTHRPMTPPTWHTDPHVVGVEPVDSGPHVAGAEPVVGQGDGMHHTSDLVWASRSRTPVSPFCCAASHTIHGPESQHPWRLMQTIL